MKYKISNRNTPLGGGETASTRSGHPKKTITVTGIAGSTTSSCDFTSSDTGFKEDIAAKQKPSMYGIKHVGSSSVAD